MKKLFFMIVALATISTIHFSCQKEISLAENDLPIPQDVIEKLVHMGFNPDGIERVDEGYRIERDIIITNEFLASTPKIHRVPGEEQYSTNNLVDAEGGRTISVYIPVETTRGRGKKKTSGFSATYVAALDEAISRFKAENLTISFIRSTSNDAEIVFTRLGKRDERRGVLGSAGFPTSAGDPYGQIKMSGVLESTYGLSVNGIATIMAHEMGHCIGFRHTDYFDRSISCGGATSNEGDGGIGANHIPGTPTGATASDQSWMLSCTDGSDRPFNNDDQTALKYLY